jgi:UDP-3-O-[3-hydroxymyristoyl] glucosamine N-acyltransferase
MKAGELARALGAELSGSADREISSARGITEITPGCLTFLAKRKYLADIVSSEASAVLVDTLYDELGDKIQMRVSNPLFSFAKALEIFNPRQSAPKGVREGAFLEENISFGKDVTVYPNAYICSGAVIGERTVIYPGVFIGSDCRVGSDCTIYPNVTIRENAVIGDRVAIHANAVIGADGFGYVFEKGIHYKIPQVGTVKIGNDVEIGAGVTIDRATTGATVIGDGTKIDNLVQIGHNVKLGRHCIIVAQVGIAGSSIMGDYVTLGGQVGVADHARIESGTMVAAKSGIMGEVKKGVYSGAPSMPHRQWLKATAIFERLPELAKAVKQLEDKLKILEGKND